MIAMRALIDNRAYFNAAAAFYRMFSHDLTYYGDNIVIEPRKITRVQLNSFSSLLQAILRFGREGESLFLIVSHGNPEALPIPIVATNSATVNVNFMNNLNSALAGSASGRQYAMSYENDRGRKVFQNERQLEELLGLIRDVRNLRIEHIEFRGCNIGAGHALRAIHQLLGSRLTAAPRVQFIWGQLATAGVRGTPDWFRNQLGQLPAVRRVFTWIDCLRSSGSRGSDTDAVLALAQTGQGREARLQLLALNSDVIKGWSQSYLQPIIEFAADREPPGGGYRRGGLLPIIGFSTPNNPGLPFVFPGDAFRYTDQIAYEIGEARWIPPLP
jgi:hypothetical protein